MPSRQTLKIAEPLALDVEMGGDLLMSPEFGPPPHALDPLAEINGDRSTMGPPTTTGAKPISRIKLIGPSSSWLGPPSLGFGLSRPASMYGSHHRIREQPIYDASQFATACGASIGDHKKDLKRSGRPRLSSMRGKKRSLDEVEGAEVKGAKSAKISTAQKVTKNATKWNTNKAAKKTMKKFSKLSIH
ncbi:hypothetical protein IFR05_002693 [Cadophora sp. M221]|nr:hypothetical protein IFR05_002693 [Cadophora sp. M221]